MKNVALLLSVATLTWGLTACGGGHHEREVVELPTVTVQTAEVTQTEWPAVYEAIGTVRAQTTATLSAKVMGYVNEVRVDAGDRVKAGQVLVVLASNDLEVGLAQAKAAQAEAKSAMAEVENAIAAAKAQLELAESTFKRMEKLHEQKSITEQEFDEASAKVRMAKANYEMANSKRGQLTEKIAQAEQGVKSASIMTGYAEIAAPFDGRVTQKMVEQGNLAAPGAPLLVVERAGRYRLEANLEESRLPYVRVGQEVEVELDALGETLTSRVSEIIPAVDAASRAFTVRINLPSNRNLRAGLFGRARFAMEPSQVTVVPADAVIQRGQVKTVYVVEGGNARGRLVSLGSSRDDQFEVLSGLTAGERIVVNAPPQLIDGSPVEVRP